MLILFSRFVFPLCDFGKSLGPVRTDRLALRRPDRLCGPVRLACRSAGGGGGRSDLFKDHPLTGTLRSAAVRPAGLIPAVPVAVVMIVSVHVAALDVQTAAEGAGSGRLRRRDFLFRLFFVLLLIVLRILVFLFFVVL